MSNYFRLVPELEYVSRLPGAKIGDYIKVKNLFRKGEISMVIIILSIMVFITMKQKRLRIVKELQ
jgi:hypothetical protein